MDLIAFDQRRRTDRKVSLWRLAALCAALLVVYHGLAWFTDLAPDRSSGPLLWVSALIFFGAADHAVRLVDEDVAAGRMELLWSTPVLERSLPLAAPVRGLRWVWQSGAWVAVLLGQPLGWDYLVRMAGFCFLLAAVGGLMGTLVALNFASRFVRAGIYGLVTVFFAATPWIAGLSAVVPLFVLLTIGTWGALTELASGSAPSPRQAKATFGTRGLYRLLDAVLRLGARAVGVERDPFFRLHRARALRRAQWWLLLAVIPMALPFLVADLLHTTVALGIALLAFPLAFAWWMVSHTAARKVVEMQTLREVPFNAETDAVAIIWGRLYPVALAWLLDLPVWIAYAVLIDRSALIVPILSGLFLVGFRPELNEVRASLRTVAAE